MKGELKRICDLMIENKRVIENEYKWQGAVTNVMLANFFTSMNKSVDATKMREADKIIKDNSPFFRNIKGIVGCYISSYISCCESPEETLKKIKEIRAFLKKTKLPKSQYLTVAATFICAYCAEDDVQTTLDKLVDIFKDMKKRHRMLTADEDVMLAALLALSDLSVEEYSEMSEKAFVQLRKISASKDAVQSLSQVLAITKADEEALLRAWDAVSLLKNREIYYSKGYELIAMGAISFVTTSLKTIISEIVEVEKYFKKERGFGNIAIGQNQRLMYALMAVLYSHKDETSNIAVSNIPGSAILCSVAIAASIAVSCTAASK